MVSKVAPGGSRHGEKWGYRVKNCSYVSLLKQAFIVLQQFSLKPGF